MRLARFRLSSSDPLPFINNKTESRTAVVYWKTSTVKVPPSFEVLKLENGASLQVVPGVREVVISEFAFADCFSNGTVRIVDEREVDIREEAFEGVLTLRSYFGSIDSKVWLPPTVEEIQAGRVDPMSLVACINLRKLKLHHFDEFLTLPPSVEEIDVDNFHGGFIPPNVKILRIGRHPDGSLSGDFSNILKLQLPVLDWLRLTQTGAKFPALRELGLCAEQIADLTGHVFPEGIVDLAIYGCSGTPIFPKSLKRLDICGCFGVDLDGVPRNTSVCEY